MTQGVLISVSAVVYTRILVSDRIGVVPYRPFSSLLTDQPFCYCRCTSMKQVSHWLYEHRTLSAKFNSLLRTEMFISWDCVAGWLFDIMCAIWMILLSNYQIWHWNAIMLSICQNNQIQIQLQTTNNFTQQKTASVIYISWHAKMLLHLATAISDYSQ